MAGLGSSHRADQAPAAESRESRWRIWSVVGALGALVVYAALDLQVFDYREYDHERSSGAEISADRARAEHRVVRHGATLVRDTLAGDAGGGSNAVSRSSSGSRLERTTGVGSRFEGQRKTDEAGRSVEKGAGDGVQTWEGVEGRVLDADASGDAAKVLSILGWVLSRDGEPVADIHLEASARQLVHPGIGGRPTSGDTFSSATTSEDGGFELPGLAEGEYSVKSKPTADYGSAYALFRAGENAAVLVVEERIADTVQIHGTVTCDRGEPLAGVYVRVPGAQGSASSRVDGGYALALTIDRRERVYGARFTKPGYRTEKLRLDLSDVADGDKIQLNAILTPVGETVVVGGRVFDAVGDPVPGASVRLTSKELQRNYIARSDEFGTFVLTDVEVGNDYRLWVHPKSGYNKYVEEGMIIDADQSDLSVLLEPLEIGKLHGQMVDAYGDPVPGFRLWLRAANPSVQQNRLITGDNAGRFTVDNLPEGEVSFYTRSAPHINVTGVRFSPHDTDTVRVPLDHGMYEVTGYVRDAAGLPVPGARISLSWSQTEHGVRSRSSRNSITDAAGYFLFTKVGAGSHTLRVDASDYRSAGIDYEVGSSSGDVIIHLDKGGQ